MTPIVLIVAVGLAALGCRDRIGTDNSAQVSELERPTSAPALALESETDRLSFLLITLDTTRADALSSYGVTQGVTPALDRIAREGVQYLQARTVAPLTLPAHASMLTGLYPIFDTLYATTRSQRYLRALQRLPSWQPNPDIKLLPS